MFNVGYTINLGSYTVRSGDTTSLLDLETHASLSVPTHAGRMVLATQKASEVQAGDEVTVELGYAETRRRVFTGTVHSVSYGVVELQIEALSVFSALTTARVNLVYEKQAAGDIVSDVLKRLDVQTRKVEPGVQFPTYVLSDGRTAWEHLDTLAQDCAFAFYADVEDQAVFAAYAPNTTHTLQYGVHILAYDFEPVTPTIVGLEVYGESPAGQGQSDDASSWFTKKEVKGSAGDASGHILRRAAATARNQSLAGSLASNLLQRYKVQARGRVHVLGAPEVQLGDAIQVTDLPVSSHNGTFRVMAVRHRLNARRGFTTEITWEKRA